MAYSLWNFIMITESSEVWQLGTDLPGQRQVPGCDLPPSAGLHATECPECLHRLWKKSAEAQAEIVQCRL